MICLVSCLVSLNAASALAFISPFKSLTCESAEPSHGHTIKVDINESLRRRHGFRATVVDSSISGWDLLGDYSVAYQEGSEGVYRFSNDKFVLTTSESPWTRKYNFKAVLTLTTVNGQVEEQLLCNKGCAYPIGWGTCGE
jgi:hypothetical protein